MICQWIALARKCLCLFNATFLILSFAFVKFGTVSLYIILLVTTTKSLEDYQIGVPSLSAICTGLLLLFIVIFGFYVICHQIPTGVEAYCVSLLILSLLKFALGFFTLIRFGLNSEMISEILKSDLIKKFQNYQSDPIELDDTQELLHCCGLNGPSDWIFENPSSISGRQEEILMIPKSCCKDLENCTNLNSVYTEGCLETYPQFIFVTNIVIGWAFILVGLTELFIGILGGVLSRFYWRKHDKYVVWM